MKAQICSGIALLAISTLPAISRGGEPTNCPAWEQREPAFLSPDNPKYFEYSFEWKQLPSKVAWNPETEKFPLDLNIEIPRAQSFLESKVTNQMELYYVLIQRWPFPKDLPANRGSDPNVISNQWLIVFSFSSPISGELRSVVSLLDGTYAKEKSFYGKPRIALTGKYLGATVPKSALRGPVTPAFENKDPTLKVDAADFNIPNVQWDPSTGPFPLDINREFTRARNYAVAATSNQKPLTFTEISIDKFLPKAAIKAKRMQIEDNLHHWLTHFSFRDSSDGYHEVSMLLNGEILGVHSRLP